MRKITLRGFQNTNAQLVSKGESLLPDGTLSDDETVKVESFKCSLQVDSGDTTAHGGQPSFVSTHKLYTDDDRVEDAVIGDFIIIDSVRYDIKYVQVMNQPNGYYVQLHLELVEK